MRTFTLNMGTSNQVAWCDMVFISACRVVIGSPWCNYNKVEYSYAHNWYSFSSNKKRYCFSSPLKICIPFDKHKDDLKSHSYFKDAFEIIFEEFDNWYQNFNNNLRWLKSYQILQELMIISMSILLIVQLRILHVWILQLKSH